MTQRKPTAAEAEQVALEVGILAADPHGVGADHVLEAYGGPVQPGRSGTPRPLRPAGRAAVARVAWPPPGPLRHPRRPGEPGCRGGSEGRPGEAAAPGRGPPRDPARVLRGA